MSGKVWIKALASGRFTGLRSSFISLPPVEGPCWGPKTKVILLWKARGDSTRQEQKSPLGLQAKREEERAVMILEAVHI